MPKRNNTDQRTEPRDATSTQLEAFLAKLLIASKHSLMRAYGQRFPFDETLADVIDNSDPYLVTLDPPKPH